MENLLFVIIAYLFGSISSAVIICRLLRLPDPRMQGSTNPGATNVLRIAGKKPAALVLFIDIMKGTLPVVLAKYFLLDDFLLACVGLAAFLGHLYPLFFHFQGGKGVATFIGVCLGLSIPLSLTVITTWLIIATCFRYASMASLVAALVAPIFSAWLASPNFAGPITLMSLMLMIAHRGNMRRLFSGNEPKIGS